MEYFTPELLLELSKGGDDDLWEDAIQRYRKHIDTFKDTLSVNLRELVECCYHDAKWLGVTAGRGGVYILTIEHQNEIVNLLYMFARQDGGPILTFPKDHDPDAEVLWRYDEVNQIDSKVFSHEILLSDGAIFRIEFTNFYLLKY